MKVNRFGGEWTNIKLNILEKYLKAYTTILKKYHYKIAYIDAFAGTGYIKNKQKSSKGNSLSLFEIEEAKDFILGSTLRALKVVPEFDKYIFIDINESNLEKLKEVVKQDFSEKEGRCDFINQDANEYLANLCKKNWEKHRAIVFLDPFGMEVKWKTIELIAKTEAIDLWILFPFGIGVNRLLTRDLNKMPKAWQLKLDSIFGTDIWKEAFYERKTDHTLFESKENRNKIATFDNIANFYLNRLKTIFTGVVEKPFYLYNSKGNPIFLYCFASGNKKGSKTAIKIAKDILIKEMGGG